MRKSLETLRRKWRVPTNDRRIASLGHPGRCSHRGMPGISARCPDNCDGGIGSAPHTRRFWRGSHGHDFQPITRQLRGNGFTEAVLKWTEIDHALASNLFWINLGAGALFTIGFAALGPVLGWFYSDARVTGVTFGVSLTILITSASVIHLALLRRAMCFFAVSANDILARVVCVAVSIFLGWAGWGYWALVAGIIALALSTSIGAWILCRWVPSFPSRAEGTTSVVRFAMHVYGQFSVNYFARNTDNLLVGWRFSAQALGFYKKAYDLFALSASQLVSPLTAVAVAALSRLNQNSVQYKRYLLSSLGVVAFVGMGLGVDLTLVGKDVIRLLLGPGWEESGRIFTYFGPGIGIMLLYGTHGWIHLSIGTADRWFRWGIVEFAFTFLLFLVALPLGSCRHCRGLDSLVLDSGDSRLLVRGKANTIGC